MDGYLCAMASSPGFEVLYAVTDVLRLIFGQLDSTSLALAANVCQKWRIICRAHVPHGRFQLYAPAIIQWPELTEWALVTAKIVPSESTGRLCERAATMGALQSLRWLRSHRFPWDSRTCATAAAQNGHLGTLRWVFEHAVNEDADKNSLFYVLDGLYEEAARGGHLDVLKWMFKMFRPTTTVVSFGLICWGAANQGHMAVLMWVADIQGKAFARSISRVQCCYGAANGGHLSVLVWAVQRMWPMEGPSGTRLRCASLAIMSGQNHIVDWINGPDSPRDEGNE